jgi:two-component system chemotaxis response regulator CheB
MDFANILILDTPESWWDSARVRILRPSQIVEPKLSADAILSVGSRAVVGTAEKVVVIGASTGGTEALKFVLEALPPIRPASSLCST